MLPALRCPSCHSHLQPEVGQRAADGEILDAILDCGQCDRSYPVREGIADFLGTPQPTTPAQRVNEWPLTAWGYERVWRPFSLTLLSQSPFPYRLELPLIARLVQPTRGGLFLDIACSNGLYARALTRAMGAASGHVAALDHALPMLRDAQQRARAARLRISFVRASAQSLPFASASMSGATIGGSLNEIGDLDQCLREASRVLVPNGRFVAMVLTTARTSVGRLIQRAFEPGGVVFFSLDILLAAFARHGLPVVERESRGIVVFTQSTKAL
ncbi:MAG: methyltransferase domain-containing protein [Roseiflexaceae bacterium]|nr:methyltransferase domain-containing protein [Roseiflexaceae bacterium]